MFQGTAYSNNNLETVGKEPDDRVCGAGAPGS